MSRAREWLSVEDGGPLAAGVPYSQEVDSSGRGSGPGGYRADCSGFVSYAWQLPQPGLDTTRLHEVSSEVDIPDLQSGDALNNQRPNDAGHVVLFLEWLDRSAYRFRAYDMNIDPGYADEKEFTLQSTSSGWTIAELDEFAAGPYIAQRLNTTSSGMPICTGAAVLAPEGVQGPIAAAITPQASGSVPDIPIPGDLFTPDVDPCDEFAFLTDMPYPEVVAFYTLQLPLSGWSIIHLEHADPQPVMPDTTNFYLQRAGERGFVGVENTEGTAPGSFVVANPHQWYYDNCRPLPQDIPFPPQIIRTLSDLYITNQLDNIPSHEFYYVTREPPQAVVDFYHVQMVANGWQLSYEVPDDQLYSLYFDKPGREEAWPESEVPLRAQTVLILVSPDTFSSAPESWGESYVQLWVVASEPLR
jgi:hypothetical protein